mmetsp:Transcript_9502/g.33662  ORF Transcript_9502/g.33662 Transcript_9502/m.33662 type:complete len:226 (-) Transcript_9502:325-1002(-)
MRARSLFERVRVRGSSPILRGGVARHLVPAPPSGNHSVVHRCQSCDDAQHAEEQNRQHREGDARQVLLHSVAGGQHGAHADPHHIKHPHGDHDGHADAGLARADHRAHDRHAELEHGLNRPPQVHLIEGQRPKSQRQEPSDALLLPLGGALDPGPGNVAETEENGMFNLVYVERRAMTVAPAHLHNRQLFVHARVESKLSSLGIPISVLLPIALLAPPLTNMVRR